jgi:CRP-like cAMP-binding protein
VERASTESTARVREALAGSEVLGALDAGAHAELAASASVRRVRRGAMLWRMAEPSDALAVVLSGCVEIARGPARGRRHVLRRLESGAVVGLSFVAGALPTADGVAAEDTTVAWIPGVAVRGFLSRRPAAALRMIETLGYLVGLLSDELVQQRDASLGTRLRAWLRTESRNGTVAVRTTHARIAERIGASRPNVTRELAKLRRAGVVHVRRGRIELARPEGL